MDGRETEQESVTSSPHGFAAISRRHTSCKPIIAAVNGLAYGGGVELVLNCDIVIASEDAVFGLPEVKRGVLASQGGSSRFTLSGSVWFGVSFMLIFNATALDSAAAVRVRFSHPSPSPVSRSLEVYE